MANPTKLPGGKPLLVIAHPGHELRVHHWCELARPDVAVLTDGSGGSGVSRVHRTTELLTNLHASPTEFYAPLSDRQLYNAVLRGDENLFIDLADQLRRLVVTGGYDYVVGDAPEGAIMGHDVLRGILDAALEAARRETGRTITSYDFTLEAMPGCVEPTLVKRAIQLRLDDAELERKVTAGLAYTELVDEVARALDTFGPEVFATECLRPSLTEAGIAPFDGVAGYERHGEQMVREGRYADVVRHDCHVAPLLAAVRESMLAGDCAKIGR